MDPEKLISQFPNDAETLFRQYPVYEQIMAEAIPHLVDGRPYNLLHTAWGIEDALTILSGESRQNLLPVVEPAFMFHDSRWDLVDGAKADPTKWSGVDSREVHMREGAKFATEVLERLKYPSEHIPQISHIVAEHDMRYVDPSWVPDSEAAALHLGVDAAFIFSPYFWKDWGVKAEGKDPQQYLEGQMKKYKDSPLYPPTAKRLMDTEIALRVKEIEAGQGDMNAYKDYYELTNQMSARSAQLATQGASIPDIIREIDLQMQRGGLSRK